MKTFHIISIVVLIQAGALFPGYVRAQEKPEDIIDKFFELYEADKSDEAVDYVFATNIWMEKTQEAVVKIKGQLRKAINLLGKYYGYQIIAMKNIGGCYVEYSYLMRYDRQPIVFTFILYKPKDKWQIHNLRFEDNLDKELEAAPNIIKIPESKE
ncbi:MAG: hypothetical protein KKA07_10065 [Bacteroidetes bacterium]|nr:hypothetical protein [Bacteroidota bacterium]MBU1719406.1 hypothetical protein [Bacteroidota bacterium]